MQSRLLDVNGRLSALIRALLRTVPAERAPELKEAQETLHELIDQSRLAWVKTTEQAFTEVEKALDKQLELITNLYDPVEGPPICVPDTNALLWNPELDRSPRSELLGNGVVGEEGDAGAFSSGALHGFRRAELPDPGRLDANRA